MDPRTKKAREIMASIRKVLFYDWDPFGVSARSVDETQYDHCISPVYHVLAKGPDEDAVIELLRSLARSANEGSEERLERVRDAARKLLAIDVGMAPPWGGSTQTDEEQRTENHE